MSSKKERHRAKSGAKAHVPVPAQTARLPAPLIKLSAGHKSVASAASRHSGASHNRNRLKSPASIATEASDATTATSAPTSPDRLAAGSSFGTHGPARHRHDRAHSRKRDEPPKKQGDRSGKPRKSTRAKPVTQVIDMHNSKESMVGLGGLLRKVSMSVAKSVKSVHRKKPDLIKEHIGIATTPSDLSFKLITEHYTLPEGELKTSDDVFRARGFKKLNKIDEGAFGVVSKALRLTDKSLVAVKEVDLRKKRAKRIEEMKRELFVLQKVNHTNVVRLIEHFTIDHTLVIIMEFCAGSNLTTYLKDTAIDETEAAFLFKQMAMSLKVLHRKGIAHRDVKLNNFLMDGTRRCIKIADFGLSIVYFRPESGIRMAKTYCGTEPYMAPELLKRNGFGARSYNAQYADIWSLGICLFAMITRAFPFKIYTSQRGLLKAQTMRRWRFPRKIRDSISEEAKNLITHMLDPEPDRRITINGVLAHPWINHDQLVVLSHDEG